MIPPSSLASLSWNGTRVGPTAAVERAHSDRARSGSKGSARVSFHLFHRARSASKKGTWPLPATFFSILLGLCCEMGIEPIADRRGHLVKVLLPSELVIGAWQKIQLLRTSQRVTQSQALM